MGMPPCVLKGASVVNTRPEVMKKITFKSAVHGIFLIINFKMPTIVVGKIMLNSAEYEIFPAHKDLNANNFCWKTFHAQLS